MQVKTWAKTTVIGLIACLVLLVGITVLVDPFFHYHKPLSMLYYEMGSNDERYLNDGILRHFDYDAIIIGTSMTRNFKTSQLDELYQVESVKIPYGGATFKEINDSLCRAFSYNKNIKLVVRSLDHSYLLWDADAMIYDYYPEYLYDDNLLNDVYYMMNKEVLLNYVLKSIRKGMEKGGGITSFDDYSSWYKERPCGKEYVLAKKRIDKITEEPIIGLKDLDTVLTEEERNVVSKSLEQNIIELVEEYPDVTFILFSTPYSIVAWDYYRQCGVVAKMIAAEKIYIESLLQYDNVKLYSFINNYGMITDLDNYKDYKHYGEPINVAMLNWMSQDEYLLTEENYIQYIEDNLHYFLTYDYDSIYE